MLSMYAHAIHDVSFLIPYVMYRNNAESRTHTTNNILHKYVNIAHTEYVFMQNTYLSICIDVSYMFTNSLAEGVAQKLI